MPILTGRLALLLVLIPTFLLGANGAEFPISAPEPAEAPFEQRAPRIASNGTDYLVVWLDTRESHEPIFRNKLYASRIDAQGHLTAPFGTRIAENIYSAAVASNGHGYVVVYSTYDRDTYARRFGDDGQPIGGPVYVAKTLVYALASNGDGYLALMSDPAASAFDAVFFDGDGVPHGGITLGDLREPALLAAGRDYRTADQEWTCDGVHACEVSVRLTSIDSNTRQVTHKTIPGLDISQWSRTNAIVGGDRIAVATISDGTPGAGAATRRITMRVVDLDGNPVSEPRLLASRPTPCFCGEYRASLAWDGTQFLVAWPDPLDTATYTPSRMIGVRVSTGGDIVDAQPFTVIDISASEFASARSATGLVIVTSQQRFQFKPYYLSPADVVVRGGRDLTDVVAGRLTTEVIGSAALQQNAAVAVSGTTAFVAWQELDQPSAIRATALDLRSPAATTATTLSQRSDVLQGGVSVAALRDFALVVWRQETGTELRILAERIGHDGVPLDATPKVIAVMNDQQIKPGSTAVATDGSQFLVVWDTHQDVFASRILDNGTVLDAQPIEVLRDPGFSYHVTVKPRVVWTGTSFLVVWGEYIESNLLISPPLPPRAIIRTSRVTAAGTVLDATDSPTLLNQIGPTVSPAVAFNGGVVMVTWAAGDDANANARVVCQHALPLDADGRPLLPSPRQFDCEAADLSGPPPEAAVVAKDNGFLALWSSVPNRDVRGRFLTTTASVGESMIVSAPAPNAWGPAAAASSVGTFVVYDRLSDAQYGGAGRIYGRILDATSTPKRRAARR